jgi:hypothetical protein
VLAAYGWPTGLEDAEILERLVALNRERAEEEARGLIRWLRPEYQAPESIAPAAQAPVQALATPLLEAEPEDSVSEAPSHALEPVVEVQPWPKDLKDQLAALRALLLASDRLWTLEAVASAFKSRGRYRDSIVAHLELLSYLGVITRLEDGPELRFHRPRAESA